MKPTELHRERLGSLASIDVVRMPGEHKYLLVFAEHSGQIQRRLVAHLHEDQAARIGAFLQGLPRSPFAPEAVPEEIDGETSDVTVADPNDEPTKVGGSE